MKEYLTSPPVLVAPQEEEDLLLYISATPQVVSAVLVAEREEEEDSAAGAPSHGAPVAVPGTGTPGPEGVALARTMIPPLPEEVPPRLEAAPTPDVKDPGASLGAPPT